jgi:hypothetical protein
MPALQKGKKEKTTAFICLAFRRKKRNGHPHSQEPYLVFFLGTAGFNILLDVFAMG